MIRLLSAIKLRSSWTTPKCSAAQVAHVSYDVFSSLTCFDPGDVEMLLVWARKKLLLDRLADSFYYPRASDVMMLRANVLLHMALCVALRAECVMLERSTTSYQKPDLHRCAIPTKSSASWYV